VGFAVDRGSGRGRLVTGDGGDYVVDLSTGSATAAGPLRYAAGDPNAGRTPVAAAAAFAPSADSPLYVIDPVNGVLAREDTPQSGTLHTVGSLGFPGGAVLSRGSHDITAFDIAADGTGWAAMAESSGLNATTEKTQRLYRIDLASGHATPAGAPGFGPYLLTGLAATGPVADDTVAPDVSVALSSTQLESRLLTDGIQPAIACAEACTIDVTATLNGHQVHRSMASLQPAVGADHKVIALPLSAYARLQVRRPGTVRLRVTIEVTDGAGNTTRRQRSVRTQTLSQRRRA
jgi:hypothetical protein